MGLRQSSPRWNYWTDCNFPGARICWPNPNYFRRWPWRPPRSSEGEFGGEHYWRCHGGAVETFIIGAALSATSLGTTFAVISSASKTVDLAQTRVGSVLVSAAVIDDVVGLVLSSIISDLGKLSNSDANLGWIIGRPIVASVAMAILTPIVTKFLFAPIFRKYIEFHFARYDHISNIILMTLVLCAFISIAAYTGTSVLFGAFLAGTFLSYLPSKRPDGPFVVMSREEGEQNEDKSPTFVHTFEAYLLGVQTYLMEPLFFASIGFAIPFVQLWTGKRIWRGILFTLLMVVAKFVVGIWIPVWKYLPWTKSKADKASKESSSAPDVPVETPKDNATMLSALLLGSAMVARGEIGLLIIEIGYNSTEYVSEEGFITGVWAILLNTIIGPVTVGLLVKFYGKRIEGGEWGLQKGSSPSQEKGNAQSAV
ncbi:Sodium/hydrogen exchanger family-domain-containing protein [Aspergillus parasiticus]|uniref:Sodium/hydrogen exchanger family-domain-containing protein n=2 Tax=Aspergillus subgen. Circumdati TaxID=2720871 RepID=A0A5N6DPV3_ASPPA|nr:Sodium/hydrogen exchanger family-domain-containing protein [Aspergillus parasiticus]KAE8310260.1 Sodium/hydrogen exchanger family-domain-containing protein [Aspergillus transmontanensis]